MKAVVLNTFGDPSVLHVAERPVPQIKEKEVLIQVVAAGINRPDVLQRKGHYPAPKGAVQDILGLEVSGIIKDTGAAVSTWKIGQEVCALVPGGGYAEYVTADAGSCLPIPQGMSLAEAAALPEVLFTVWHNLFQRAQLKRGEEALIYGGSGGIGSMAIQLATLSGSRVTTLAGSEGKAAYCQSLGAQKVVLYKKHRLLDQVSSESIDVILDSLGGNYLETNLEVLKPEGRLVYINAMEGAKPQLNIMKMMQKRLHLTGSTLRSRSNHFKAKLAKDILAHAYPLLEDVQFKPMVKYRFPLDQAAEAHALMDSRSFTGKMILFI